MNTQVTHFNNIVDAVYDLPLEVRVELKNLLEHNIADSKRDELVKHYKSSLKEQRNGKLRFSLKMSELRKML